MKLFCLWPGKYCACSHVINFFFFQYELYKTWAEFWLTANTLHLLGHVDSCRIFTYYICFRFNGQHVLAAALLESIGYDWRSDFSQVNSCRWNWSRQAENETLCVMLTWKRKIELVRWTVICDSTSLYSWKRLRRATNHQRCKTTEEREDLFFKVSVIWLSHVLREVR